MFFGAKVIPSQEVFGCLGLESRWRSPLPCIGSSRILTNRHLLEVEPSPFLVHMDGMGGIILKKTIEVEDTSNESTLIKHKTLSLGFQTPNPREDVQ